MKPGDRHGSLILLRQHRPSTGRGHTWACWCDCGAMVRLREHRLVHGLAKTCANRLIHPRPGR